MKEQIEEMAKIIADKAGLSIVQSTGIAEILTIEDYCKQIKGEWGFDGMSWTCSECGEYAPISRKFRLSKFNYCPNCGAKMKGGAE